MFRLIERTEKDQKVKFVLSKTTLPIANGLRRVLLSEIDTPAIDVNTISFSEDLNFTNTSSLHDEFLSHRISYAVLDVSLDRVEDLQFFICDPADIDRPYVNSTDDIIDFTTNHFTIIDTKTGQRVDPESIFLAENLINRLKPQQQLKSSFTATVRKVKEANKETCYNHQPGRVKFTYTDDFNPTSFVIEFCSWGQRNLNAVEVIRQAFLVLEGKVNKVIGQLDTGLEMHPESVWENSWSVKIKDEDHTLGNMLTEAIMQSQQDDANSGDCYVAYQKKHPLENELEIRIKMGSSTQTARDCLHKSCKALHRDIQTLTKSFEKAISDRA